MLSVTANLFRHRGYAGVGIDDIGELGVTSSALYRYFHQAVVARGHHQDFVHSVEKERGIQAARVGTGTARTWRSRAALTVGFAKADALLVYLRQLRRLDEPMRAPARCGYGRRLEEGWDATLSHRGERMRTIRSRGADTRDRWRDRPSVAH
ncbi:helix-turn-helix transcriptional regulator [Pseudonocardia sp. MCCB 268]|nr:helix-turn-helix transcriptional regulator [Pseudonocardia cytotoxica]